MNKCVICRKELTDYGNNAAPVRRGRCCDYCNANVVIPMRLALIGTNWRAEWK